MKNSRSLTESRFSFLIEKHEKSYQHRAIVVSTSPVSAVRTASLSALEVESIEMFIGFFKLIGLPKSVGEISGLLCVSSGALGMDDVMERLGISLGAASQGLKVLRSVGAVKVVYTPGERRDRYAADLELSKFATSFIKEELQPRVDRALSRIEHMESLADAMDPQERHEAQQRLERLKHWLKRGESMLPWLLKFLIK